MTIPTNEEHRPKKYSDKQLLKHILTFAKPYWKLFVFSLLLTTVIVIASLAQPYIIKVAIDSHINGIYAPMIFVDHSEKEHVLEVLDEQGVKGKEITTFEEHTYFRMSETDHELPATVQKASIVSIEGSHYLIHGWDTGIKNQNDVQLSNDTIAIDGMDYPIISLQDDEQALFRSHDYSGMIWLGVLYFILIITSSVTTYFQNNTLQFTGQSVIYDIRESMMKHFSRLQVSFYDKNPIGRLVTRITHDVEALNQLYSQVIVNLIREVLMLIGIVVIMLQMSVKLTLISFTVIPLIAILTLYLQKVLRKAQRYLRLVLSQLNAYLAENLSGMKVIQIFAREEKQLEQFNELNQEHYRAGMRQTVLSSIFNPSIGFFGNISMALLIWYGGRNVIDGALTFGVVYAFTHYVRQFFEPLRGLADRFNQIQAALASAERIFDTLETKPSIVNKPDASKLPNKVNGKIEFKNVWFAYQEKDWVLKDVSFSISPGETVGIVGATGAGKSSIIQLINRFYDIQQGSIHLDGVSIKDVEISDLRKHVGIIQQDSFVFSGTVFDNIRLNNRDISDEDIIRAASSVGIDPFFSHLPNQYETLLGEQGTVLSTGQRQLLSFLRAMIANPDVLILDEATANIDTETEIVVQDTLKKISKNRTTIIIAHRLSTIQHADNIIVLDKGKIIEMGDHASLLQQKGAYYRLCMNQNEQKMAKKQKKRLYQ
ncbi:ABC transporter ATP-binding protein [Bacillus sinesaloumensis]|uniref:ABC transporter ATP-binding protein n=1 Tax=Litchfieldia sinesaloumensis TaxID=1926280 RepID=UPI000988605F|nr:ABC transporter ATP-binding protein [Bacillus sinesaloumensis]